MRELPEAHMVVKIIPTVLARTREEFDQRLQKLLPVADELQVDFEDGKFVPSTGVGMHEIPDLTRYQDKIFEAHLMVRTPGAFIQPAARRGFRRVIFHVEVIDERIMAGLLDQCRKYEVIPVLAINPETPVDFLLPYLDGIDCVLFLGVHPGFNGAPYVPETAGRIAEFLRKSRRRDILIQVDGGMTPETVGKVAAAGASRINSGSFISNAPDPKAAIAALMTAAEAAMPAIASKPSATPVPITPAAAASPRKSISGITNDSGMTKKSVKKPMTSRPLASKRTISGKKAPSLSGKSKGKRRTSKKSTDSAKKSTKPGRKLHKPTGSRSAKAAARKKRTTQGKGSRKVRR